MNQYRVTVHITALCGHGEKVVTVWADDEEEAGALAIREACRHAHGDWGPGSCRVVGAEEA